MLASNARGKEEANALFLVTERVRTAHLAQSGLPAREKISSRIYHVLIIGQDQQ